eukprot:TRINITY_DN19307_c2_g2_i1.p1 TRINITY_DN19307_c2_g2~~TRINITY_DN19307_c2_g2_i1.p1  ORF type:complete len:398 (+),score=61.05 TRINITY_DN19307_c2_g2_i1:40-1194(+)
MKTWIRPPSLPDNLKEGAVCRAETLRNKTNGNTVHIVGVSHMSLGSREDVRRIVKWARPDCCLVELCWDRLDVLSSAIGRDWEASVIPDITKFENLRIMAPTLLSPTFWLVGLQLSRMEAILQTYDGAEQMAAIEEAQKYREVKVYPIDTPVSTTLLKCATSLWFEVGPVKLASDIYTNDVFGKILPCVAEVEAYSSRLDDLMEQKITPETYQEMRSISEKLADWDGWRAVLSALEETVYLKGIVTPLLRERDSVLAYQIHKVSEMAKTSVAVVGAAHVEGVAEKFGVTTLADVENAQRVPTTELYTMAAQIFACTLVTPGAALFAQRTARRRGGNAWKYFRYARAAWFTTSTAGSLYWMHKLYGKYTSTRSFQMRMMEYRSER